MAETPNLGLPQIAAAQAQKHVTHNEALAQLDAVVQLAVLSRTTAAPPAAPAEGDRLLLPGSATGAFAGKAGQIAFFDAGLWRFMAPKAGWIAFVADERVTLVHDGTNWGNLGDAIGALNQLPMLGVGAEADATNKLAVRSPAALFTAPRVASGGNGDMRLVLEKEAAARTASLLFQSDYSGRAEFGLTGDDDVHIKVSPDGAVWREAILVDRMTGEVSFPNGASSIAAGAFSGGALSNILLNPDHAVSQENADSAVSGNGAGGGYVTDQWAVARVGSMATTVQRVTDAPAGYSHSLKLTITTAQASLAAADLLMLHQPIEKIRLSRLAPGTAAATVSRLGGWVKASVAGTYGVAIGSWSGSAVDASWVGQIVVNAADTWEYKTFAVPAASTGTWGATPTALGAYLFFALAAGADRVGVTGWQSGDKRSVAGAVNLAATNGASFQQTGWMWLPGTDIPAEQDARLMRPDTALSLQQCARYWQTADCNLYPIPSGFGAASSNISFAVPMRAVPGFSIIAGSEGNASTRTLENVTRTGARFTVVGNGGGYSVGSTAKLNARM